ncbi:putative tricarboxylic transport membrane protein [Arthrobacter pigmenti]|uniref:Putative tricarboxylic transport membrane protein n=1 Tax=Arthrobacter pigmenti TaxID=271432 RepID=A0A846RK56_9MICC|nr:tripartite tricarboxylate transporter TctB family protein [Arthrobacter pigmenti]NJC23698.1 putative tricarboxylic transport membrane protein [Arthrobacter pigmenti]
MSKPATSTAEPEVQESPAGPNKILLVGVPVALMALAAAVIFTSFGLGYWTTLGPGPGFFPFWIGILLATSSAVWLVQALRGNPNVIVPAEAPVAVDPAAESTAPTAKKRPIWIVLLSLIVLASLLDVLGFQLTMFAFLLFQLKFQGGRKWPLSLIIALVGSFGVFHLFTDVLQVTLPTSSIGFLENLGL